MSFYITIGYSFPLDADIGVDGSILLCGKLPMHQLERRPIKPASTKKTKKPRKPKPPKYPHMMSLLFDPQLYLAGLSPNQGKKAPGLCANLASYPWFGVSAMAAFDSGAQKQKEWKDEALLSIRERWPGSPPTSAAAIQLGIQECVDLQRALGCEAIILPSPLTHEQGTAYDAELAWLDAGLTYAETHSDDLPIYATVAISDLCLRFHEPEDNGLLDLIADAVSARGVDGVYLVVEQASEAADARQCANAKVLASVLHLVHLLARDCEIDVVTNFFGAFGVVASAVGARVWSSNWYKSLHRLRIADQGQDGRAVPSYWSTAVATDIHLETDFDTLVANKMLPQISDNTVASAGLLAAAAQGRLASSVPAWTYRMGNVTVCTEHSLRSAVALERTIGALDPGQRVNAAEDWLKRATANAQQIATMIGSGGSTRTNHVAAWLEALKHYRRIHNV